MRRSALQWTLAVVLLALLAPHLHVSARLPPQLQRAIAAAAAKAAEAANAAAKEATAMAAHAADAASYVLHHSKASDPHSESESDSSSAVIGSVAWPTMGGSNARQGVTPLPLPIHLGGPMRQIASQALILPDDKINTRAVRCASSVVADASGRVFALCAWPNGASALHASLLCFDASSSDDAAQASAGPKLLWHEPLGAVPDELDNSATLSGSLALTADGAWLLVSTRAATYAFSAPLGGKPQWLYAAEGAVGPIGSGLLVSLPDPLLQMQPRIYVGVNQGLACISNGKLMWSFRATAAPAGSRVSMAAAHEASNAVLYSFWDPATSSVYLVALDASSGVERWSHSFSVPAAFARAAATSRLQQAPPTVAGDHAFLSVAGRGMVVVSISTGAQLSDGTGPLAGTRVQIGLTPVLQRADSSAEVCNFAAAFSDKDPMLSQDIIISVCTESSVGPKVSRSFELCATDINGVNIDIAGKYVLGCSARSEDASSFRSMAPLAQPLLGGNRVIMLALASDAFVVESDSDSDAEPDAATGHHKSHGCVQALPDLSLKLKPWSTTLHHDASFHATPLMLTARIAVGLSHSHKGFSMFVLQARNSPSVPQHSESEAELPVELPIPVLEPVPAEPSSSSPADHELVDPLPAQLPEIAAIPIRKIDIKLVALE